MDFLFKPRFGAALQHLKVEIGSDTNSTDGSEPSHARSADDRDYTRGYEWWLMREARERNPDIVLDALCWACPGWLGGGCFYSQDTADYIADFVEGALFEHHLDIAYVGVWNEMNYNTDWIKRLKRTLVARGMRTRVVAADGHFQPLVTDMAADADLFAAVDVLGAHYPTYGSPSEAQAWGKPLWGSEDGAWNKVPDGESGEWSGARELAKIYNRNYIAGKITKTLVWSPVTAYYDSLMIPGSGLMYANTPWSGHYRVQPSIWVTAHTTQFVGLGWRYLDRACGYLPNGGSYVTLISPDTDGLTVVVETIDSAESQELEIIGFEGPLRLWRTTPVSQFEQLSDIEGGSFELEPNAVYTLSTEQGQQKGVSQPPPPANFPFPYRESFSEYQDGDMTRLLSDQEGRSKFGKDA